MFVTRKADYAIRCVLYLTKTNGRTATIGEIASQMEVPGSFLAKILQQLMKAGIVRSARGITGGFMLAKKPEEITLLDVIEIIQGPPEPNICAVDGRKCNLSDKCVVHPVWVKIRKHIDNELRGQNFAKLAGYSADFTDQAE